MKATKNTCTSAKNYLLLFSFLLTVMACKCQSAKIEKKELIHLIYSKNHLALTVVPALYSKARIERFAGSYILGSTAQIGGEAGASFHLNFNDSYSLISGFQAGIGGRNFIYKISKDDFHPSAKKDENFSGGLSRTLDLSYYSIPLLFERRWQNGKNFFNLDLGISLRIQTQDVIIGTQIFTQDINSNNVPYFNMELFNTTKPCFNYNLSIGKGWFLGNNNIIKSDLLVNVSFDNLVEGSYTFTVSGQPITKGNYRVNGSYIGVGLKYIITGINNRLQKLYYKQISELKPY